MQKRAFRNSIGRMTRRALIGILFVVPAILLLSSCGIRAAGYGVVLWGEQGGPLSTGSIVLVVRESPINASYLVSVTGEKKPREFPMGRMRFFRKKAEAFDFAKSFTAYRETWAFSQKQDPPPLPIRDQAKSEAKVIYKLKPGQLLKVVSRSAAKETIKPYSDYWYEVATEDGYGGFCFGHFLKVFTTSGDPAAEARRLLSQDETLERIMGNTWRPDWFREMAAKGTIDLATFREDVGLFPSPADSMMRLSLPLSAIDFRYAGIEKLGPNTYAFTGSDLRITVLDEERISISYRYKDQPVSGLYAIMKSDVAELIAGEQKRRSDLFDSFFLKGQTLTSSAYGTIRLEEGMRFSWQSFQKLVPSLIGREAKGKGTVDFPFHVARELAGTFHGVITFTFDDYPDAPGPSFLYTFVPGGVRFASLAKDSISNLIVTHPAMTPVVIFFNQSGQ